MFPIMWFFVGFRENPQRTHRWNKRELSQREIRCIDQQQLVMCTGNPEARKQCGLLAHLPTWLVGWRNYVVVKPCNLSGVWYVGWIAGDAFAGISRIPLTKPCKLLVGPGPVGFFATDSNGVQIPIRKIGEGQIGVKSQFSWLPLR